MSVNIQVPPLGESVTEATVGAILKASGSQVRADEEILELETDKVNQVLYAPAAGAIELKVKTGDKVLVGQVIGSVDPAKKGAAPAAAEEKPKAEPKVVAAAPAVVAPALEPGPFPSARKPAEDLLIEKQILQEKSSMAPKLGERKKMSKLRKVIAQRLVEVKNQTAMLTTFNEVDMSAIIAVREKEQETFQKRYGVKLGFMSFFVKACVAALQQYPEINARIEGDEIVYFRECHIGIAVSTEKGLMVPVLRNAEKMSYAEIETALKKFAQEARTGSISVDALQGGTFTITNGGTFGSLLSTPILNPPQSGILGMHAIVKRPIAVDDEVQIRPMMYLALSYDHRIVDGQQSIGFLMHIKKNLEEPARLLLGL